MFIFKPSTIIISSILFGSIYLNSVSMVELNKILLKPTNDNYKLYILNVFVFSSSGIVICLFSIKALKLLLL